MGNEQIIIIIIILTSKTRRMPSRVSTATGMQERKRPLSTTRCTSSCTSAPWAPRWGGTPGAPPPRPPPARAAPGLPVLPLTATSLISTRSSPLHPSAVLLPPRQRVAPPPPPPPSRPSPRVAWAATWPRGAPRHRWRGRCARTGSAAESSVGAGAGAGAASAQGSFTPEETKRTSRRVPMAAAAALESS